MTHEINNILERRFGDAPEWDETGTVPKPWQSLAGRGSCRRFQPEPLAPELVQMLCALSLSAPSKSDLQQRDIIIIDDPDLRAGIDGLLTPGQPWIRGAPHLVVFLGNNHRQRQIHQMRGHPFANDHLDAFFNAAVDAGIALSAFVIAAEAAGLGVCPISAIRNHAARISQMLKLPDHVFPIAGMALGRPARQPLVTPRLPLSATVHRNHYDEEAQEPGITAYDLRRHGMMPFRTQREPERFGTAEPYVWSEEKARHYASPERGDFGQYIRDIGFKLD